MPSSSLTVTLEAGPARLALDRLLVAGLGDRAAKWVGHLVVEQTQKRFSTATSPDGTPWAPLNPAYAATKTGGGILVGAGTLRDTIHFQTSGSTVEVGSTQLYARIHQLGGTITPKGAGCLHFFLGPIEVLAKAVRIPARPYLGLSTEDQREIEEELVGQWRRILGGGPGLGGALL
jgi:phage virion morphogenesis protein